MYQRRQCKFGVIAAVVVFFCTECSLASLKSVNVTKQHSSTTLPFSRDKATTLALHSYSDCGSTKGCFGIPADCIASQTCVALIKYSLVDQAFEFELFTQGKLWVGAGLSDDRHMSADSVMECVLEENATHPVLYGSWNEEGRKDNYRVNNTGLMLLTSSYTDDLLYCHFIRDQVTNVEGKDFDLSLPWYLLLAAGNRLRPEGVGYHSNFESSSTAVNFSDFTIVPSSSKVLVKLHGAFMLTAWIGAASTGILLARYFKQTWVGSQMCGKPQWFAWHRTLMVLTWCLTVAGFIIIFVELGAWSSADNPHAILGVITTALAFIQPFMAALRPQPHAPHRVIFNWAHLLLGNLSHIFAIVTIFFAVSLSRANLPKWILWILVTFLLIYVVTHLILTAASFASDRRVKANTATVPSDEINPDNKKKDSAYSMVRKTVFTCFLVSVGGLCIALIVIVILSPI